MAKENSFTWGSATIGYNSQLTVADEERVYDLVGRLGERGSARSRYVYAEFQFAAKINGELPLPLVDEHSSDEDIEASWQAWGKLPRGFLQKWRILANNAEDDDPK